MKPLLVSAALALQGAGCSSGTGGGGVAPAVDASQTADSGLLGPPDGHGVGIADGASTDTTVSTVVPSPSDSRATPSPDDAPAVGDSGSTNNATEAGPGPVDATPTTTSEAGPSDASSPGLFTEDFERGTLDPTIWATQFNGGQTVATVQTANVAHGKYAVQFHANPSVVSYDFIITKNAPAALQGHHFGRAYFYISPKPPAQHTELLFAGTAGFPKLKYLEVATIGAGWQLTYVDLTGAAAVESYASGGTTPLARWACLEWEFNDAPDQATVLVDGQPSFAFSNIVSNGKSTGLVGSFTDFGFGYYAWHPATYPFDVYYDDIVLDTKRVGCLP